MEFNAYLAAQDTQIDKFDGDLFRSWLRRLRYCHIVEVEFVYKAGVEVRGGYNRF